MATLYAVLFDGALEPEFRRETLEEAEADGYATVAGNEDVEYFVIVEEDTEAAPRGVRLAQPRLTGRPAALVQRWGAASPTAMRRVR